MNEPNYADILIRAGEADRTKPQPELIGDLDNALRCALALKEAAENANELLNLTNRIQAGELAAIRLGNLNQAAGDRFPVEDVNRFLDGADALMTAIMNNQPIPPVSGVLAQASQEIVGSFREGLKNMKRLHQEITSGDNN